jgi:hypothetical protein
MKLLTGVVGAFLLFCMAGVSQATLTSNLKIIGTAQFGGSDIEYNLIWDNDNNYNSVVWLDCTNYAHATNAWEEQMSWAAGLDSALTINLDEGYSVNWGANSWRLPSAGSSPDYGYNQAGTEMGHLFYNELGLQNYPDRGNRYITTAELNDTIFNKLVGGYYWSATEYENKELLVAWAFNMAGGSMGSATKGNRLPGFAVRTGEISSVPIPGAILLLGAGLLGIAGIRRKK